MSALIGSNPLGDPSIASRGLASAIDAQVKASGASTITVNIDGILDVDADGLSSIYYLGSPEMGTINTSGGSNVGQR